FVFDSLVPQIAMFLSWSVICIIAFLSGIELPALMSSSPEKLNILAFDYIGMCLGGLLFTTLFLPIVGLLTTSFLVATLNLCIAHLLFMKLKTKYSYLFSLLYCIPLGLLIKNEAIQKYIEGVFIAS